MENPHISFATSSGDEHRRQISHASEQSEGSGGTTLSMVVGQSISSIIIAERNIGERVL